MCIFSSIFIDIDIDICVYVYICIYVYVNLEHVMGIKTSALEGQATACHMLVRMYVPIMFVCIYYSVYF